MYCFYTYFWLWNYLTLLFDFKAALLLKSQVEAVMQDDLDSDTDTHVMELMAPTVDIEE